MNISTTHRRRRLITISAVAGLTLLTACGSDSDTAPATAPTTPATTPDTVPDTVADTIAQPSSPPTTTSTSDPEDAAPVTVAGADYQFVGVPAEVAAGTRLAFQNESTTELHEMVAVRIPDADTRPLLEIVTGDLGSLFGSEPSFVMLAAPGGEQITPVGDGVLSEPGRYALVCMIPTGIEPGEYLAAAAESAGGPPVIEGGGPPHIFNGMYAELTVAPGS